MSVTDADNSVASNASVEIRFHGQVISLTTDSSGQVIYDLANAQQAYSNGDKYRVEAYTSRSYFEYIGTVNTTVGFDNRSIQLNRINYSNLLYLSQKVIYNILNSDSEVSFWTSNIYDRIPLKEIWKGSGFPYLIIHTPDILSEEKLTQGNTPRYKTTIQIKIEIYDRAQINIRRIGDAVRNALKTNTTTTRFSYLWKYTNSRGNLSWTALPDEETYPIYKYTVSVDYLVLLV